jgi:hypothetical protein
MFTSFKPHDLIALLLIGVATFLHTRGDTIMAPMLLSSIIGFYFAVKASNGKEIKSEN